MSDPAEEATQAEGAEPITIRVRDQVSGGGATRREGDREA
jgi:hypothetical protein